jgi:hypothetical protein
VLKAAVAAVLHSTENWVPRIIFGLNRVEMTGGWRKMQNEKLHNLYSSPSMMRMIK